jgi:acetyl-CoA carboxylase carboxyltransferase component
MTATSDVNSSWHSVAVMAVAGGATIHYRHTIDKAPNSTALEVSKSSGHEAAFNISDLAAARGSLGDVIEPHKTRPYLIRDLDPPSTKRERRSLRKQGDVSSCAVYVSKHSSQPQPRVGPCP